MHTDLAEGSILYIYIYSNILWDSPFQTSGVPGDVRLATYARGGFMKFQLLHKAVAGLLGSCAGVLLLTTLIVLGNSHVKKRLQLHLLDITCWVCQAQNENDTERILHAANHRLVRFTFMNGGIQASLSTLLVLHCIFVSKLFVITMYGGYTIFLLNTRGGWAYFGSKEVTVIFALSLHTLGYIGRRWLSKLEPTVFGNTLTKVYQNCNVSLCSYHPYRLLCKEYLSDWIIIPTIGENKIHVPKFQTTNQIYIYCEMSSRDQVLGGLDHEIRRSGDKKTGNERSQEFEFSTERKGTHLGPRNL